MNYELLIGAPFSRKRMEISFLASQIFVYFMFVSVWSIVVFQIEQNPFAVKESIRAVATLLFILWLVFATNNYLLVPKIYDSKWHPKLSKWIFWVINMVFIVLLNSEVFGNGPRGGGAHDGTDQPWFVGMRIGIYLFGVVWMAINYAMIGLAFGRRSYLKQQQVKNQLIEEQQKNTEAELAWLKNQLNPHFLFNTLNNISSLTQIDPDMAQDKIGQLSDLLRYALYETKEEFVDINGELEFMQNYIDLMSLRCGPNVDIQTSFNIQNTSRKIAPMLFLSPIENAFKHGVSSNKQSFIHITLKDDDNTLTFTCENSNYPKSDKNRSGSGIGVENMQRRLQLIYPNHYQFEQKLEEETYKIKIQIL